MCTFGENELRTQGNLSVSLKKSLLRKQSLCAVVLLKLYTNTGIHEYRNPFYKWRTWKLNTQSLYKLCLFVYSSNRNIASTEVEQIPQFAWSNCCINFVFTSVFVFDKLLYKLQLAGWEKTVLPLSLIFSKNMMCRR
jgi:hypothetical protein